MKNVWWKFSTPYRLHCYEPLERFEDANARCDSCGESNLQIDLEHLWTRERRFLELERVLKALVCLTMVGIGSVALLFPGMGTGIGHGMAIGAPIVMGILLWDLASITRRASLFRADIVWPIVGWLLGPPLLFLAVHSREMLLGGAHYTLVAVSAVLTILAIGSPFIRRWWANWRENRITKAQLQAIDLRAQKTRG